MENEKNGIIKNVKIWSNDHSCWYCTDLAEATWPQRTMPGDETSAYVPKRARMGDAATSFWIRAATSEQSQAIPKSQWPKRAHQHMWEMTIRVLTGVLWPRIYVAASRLTTRQGKDLRRCLSADYLEEKRRSLLTSRNSWKTGNRVHAGRDVHHLLAGSERDQSTHKDAGFTHPLFMSLPHLGGDAIREGQHAIHHLSPPSVHATKETTLSWSRHIESRQKSKMKAETREKKKRPRTPRPREDLTP